MAWKITPCTKNLPKLKQPVFIEGLPGIGNVGKVAVDFLIDELKAKKLYDVFSYTFPHSVFVNENNLVELPKIELYYAQLKGIDLLFLAGDVQPIDEVSSYEFCEKILDLLEDYKCREIITLGGIGLQAIPKTPRVYCTGNSKKIIQKYKKGVKLNDKLYGVVGPIVGVSGLLLGLAKKREIEAIAMLAETFGHPMYLGIKGARSILEILNKKLSLNLDIAKLEKEIVSIESEMLRRTDDLSKVSKHAALQKMKSRLGKDINYIG
ncbi:PAC2 family protein [Candidatus Woesearchaeota archaeon]|nr:PAC2 family protein [Candidatus Woesearchaeota archaeon]